MLSIYVNAFDAEGGGLGARHPAFAEAKPFPMAMATGPLRLRAGRSIGAGPEAKRRALRRLSEHGRWR
jgi:hypothetical protein